MSLTTSDLGRSLAAQFARYEADRLPLEQRMLQNYRQYRGEYDPDVEIAKGRSKAYPKITRAKCISVVSRLMQMLFPVSEKNWGVEPSPVPNMSEAHLRAALAQVAPEAPDEEVAAAIYAYAKARSDLMSKEMEDQLVEIGGTKELPYVSLCKKVIESGTKFGMGVLKGPLVRSQTQTRWRRNALAGNRIEIYTENVYRPYYEVTPPWNYYPDLSAKTFGAMDGQYERHPMSRQQLLALAALEGFDAEQINAFIAAHPNGNFRWRTFETALRQMGPQERTTESRGKFEAVSYWGQARAGDLRAAMDPEAAAALAVKDDEMVEVQTWMLEQYVIRADVNVYQPHLRPYHHFVFEEDDSSLVGEGLPFILRDSQLGVSAATRMVVDNAAVAAGPQFEVNKSLMAGGIDTQTIHAFKVWERDDEGPTSQYPAIRDIKVDSHIVELLNIIALFKDFADTESFINPASSGDFERTKAEPLRTSQGASMFLAGAALPFRDVVRNFDAFTLSVISSLVQWNMQFSARDEIKGDHQVVARGASSLMAKEVRAQSLDQLSLTLRPEEAANVDFRGLVTERVKVRDLPVDQLIVPQAEADRRADAQALRADREAQLQREMVEAEIKVTVASAVQKLAQAQKAGAASEKLIAEVIQSATGNGADR